MKSIAQHLNESMQTNCIAICGDKRFKIMGRDADQFVMWNGIWCDDEQLRVASFEFADKSTYVPTYRDARFGDNERMWTCATHLPQVYQIDENGNVIKRCEQRSPIYNFDYETLLTYIIVDENGQIADVDDNEFDTLADAKARVKELNKRGGAYAVNVELEIYEITFGKRWSETRVDVIDAATKDDAYRALHKKYRGKHIFDGHKYGFQREEFE